jgi:hypothetical protein
MQTLGLSASGFTRMSAAVFKIEQLIRVILNEQGNLLGQRHWFRKITDKVLNVWFVFFCAHGRLLSGDREKGIEKTENTTFSQRFLLIPLGLKSIFKICCIVFNFNL